MYDSERFVDFLLRNGIVGLNENGVPLNTGGSSSYYVSGRNLSRSTRLLEEMAGYVVELAEQEKLITLDLDAVLGIPAGARELGNAVSRVLIEKGQIKDQLYFTRDKLKDHGDPSQRLWINGVSPKKIILLEDVTRSASSIIKFLRFVDELREQGAVREGELNIEGVVCLVDRLQLAEGKTAQERMREEGLNFFSLTNANELLPEFLSSISDPELREQVREKILQEYAIEYCEAGRESPINLEELK